jgi:hypothetical protein
LTYTHTQVTEPVDCWSTSIVKREEVDVEEVRDAEKERLGGKRDGGGQCNRAVFYFNFWWIIIRSV